MRTTRVLSAADLAREAWVTLLPASTVQIPAPFARRFKLMPNDVTVIEPPFEPVSGQPILLRIEQPPDAGHAVTFNGFTTRGTIVVSATAAAVSFVEMLYDDDALVWELVGVSDLSSVYDAAGAAAAAQTNAQNFATAADATVLATAEAYTDAAVAGIVSPAPMQFWSVLGNLIGATTYYAAPGGSLLVVEYKFPVTRACVLRRLYVNVTDAPGGAATLTVTLRQSGADTGVTVTLTGAATSGNDTTHTATLVAGELVSMSVVTSALAVPKNVTMGFEIDAS